MAKLTARNDLLLDEFGVAVQSLGQADTSRAWNLVGRVGPDVLHKVAEAVVRRVTGVLDGVELGRLPLPRAPFEDTLNSVSRHPPTYTQVQEYSRSKVPIF
jgi:hypothetical protein